MSLVAGTLVSWYLTKQTDVALLTMQRPGIGSKGVNSLQKVLVFPCRTASNLLKPGEVEPKIPSRKTLVRTMKGVG